MSELTDKAIAILVATNDGDDLDPMHLKLVEHAVNGFLNESGIEVFEQLHQNATKPEGYTKPWLHDVEHLTRDIEGFVFWKGKRIDHFSFRDYDEERATAQLYGRACTELEARGIEITLVPLCDMLDELKAAPPLAM